MVGHTICFNGEIWLIIPKLSLFPLVIQSTAWNLQVETDSADPDKIVLMKQSVLGLHHLLRQFCSKL